MISLIIFILKENGPAHHLRGDAAPRRGGDGGGGEGGGGEAVGEGGVEVAGGGGRGGRDLAQAGVGVETAEHAPGNAITIT